MTAPKVSTSDLARWAGRAEADRLVGRWVLSGPVKGERKAREKRGKGKVGKAKADQWIAPVAASAIQYEDGECRIVLPPPPSLNAIRCISHGKLVTVRQARDYKATVVGACMAGGLKPLSGPVEVSISLYGNDRLDADNCLKLVLDGLKRLAFHDDRQIDQLSFRRYRGLKYDLAGTPAMVVVVRALTVAGRVKP